MFTRFLALKALRWGIFLPHLRSFCWIEPPQSRTPGIFPQLPSWHCPVLPQLIGLGHCLLSFCLGGRDESFLFFILGVGPAHGCRQFFPFCLLPLGFLLGLPLRRDLGLCWSLPGVEGVSAGRSKGLRSIHQDRCRCLLRLPRQCS